MTLCDIYHASLAAVVLRLRDGGVAHSWAIISLRSGENMINSDGPQRSGPFRNIKMLLIPPAADGCFLGFIADLRLYN